ncbi:MAG: hypothetical protein DRH51_01490 [Candidatus Coatesbacteria bacterium]|nr:MAG: hypothetical protein DRH51_01490 [Candidatus Coatesbacteria bacterium]
MKKLNKHIFFVLVFLSIYIVNCSEDANQPENPPQLVGSIDLSSYGRVEDVAVKGNYAYIAAKDGGLIVVDISDPENPTFKKKFTTPNPLWRIFISGNYLYGACSSGGLVIFDISDINSIRIIGDDRTNNSWAYGVYADSNLAFWVGASHNAEKGVLAITDISDPDNPLNISYIEVGVSWCYGVYASGSRVFVGDASGTLHIYDISDPTSPEKIATLADGGEGSCIFNLTVRDNKAYLCNNLKGLLVIDVENPEELKLLGRLDINYGFYDLVLNTNDICYSSASWGGLRTINISNPTNPTETRSAFCPEFTCIHGIDKYNNYVYIADSGTHSLMIVDISE